MEIIRLELSGNRGKDGGTRGKEGVKGKWGEIIWDYRARLAGADVTSMRSEWESDYKWKGVSNSQMHHLLPVFYDFAPSIHFVSVGHFFPLWTIDVDSSAGLGKRPRASLWSRNQLFVLEEMQRQISSALRMETFEQAGKRAGKMDQMLASCVAGLIVSHQLGN